MPTVFTSLEFLKTQTSFRSFSNDKSGNIHRLYVSIGKNVSLSRQAESNLPGFVVYYIRAVYSSSQDKMLYNVNGRELKPKSCTEFTDNFLLF